MVPNINCVSADGVNFIDMNGDGLDDLVYIDAYGNAFLSINQGDGNRATGRPPTFKSVSSTGKIKENEGYARDKVRVADIDGDGRGDYGVWDGSGWKFWRNGWVDDIPKYWQALGVTLKGLDVPNIDGYIFADINGDVRGVNQSKPRRLMLIFKSRDAMTLCGLTKTALAICRPTLEAVSRAKKETASKWHGVRDISNQRPIQRSTRAWEVLPLMKKRTFFRGSILHASSASLLYLATYPSKIMSSCSTPNWTAASTGSKCAFGKIRAPAAQRSS